MKKSFIVSGYTSANYIIRVPSLPSVGMTAIIQNKDNSTLYYGGNGLNVAVYFAQLGMNAVLIFRGGSDFEAQGYPEFLAKNNVSTKAVSIVKEDVTPLCYLPEDEGNNHITFFYPGSMHEKYAPESYPDEYFDGIDWAVMTVASRPDNEAFLKAVKKHDLPMAFVMRPDPHSFPPDFLDRALHESRIIFMNEMEQGFIKDYLGYEPVDELLKNGKADAVVVTHGPEGCIVYTRENGKINSSCIPATKPDAVVDTTGAGDSFVAGFMYGVVNGCAFSDCAKYGATVSSFIIEAQGCLTNVPTEEEMIERLNSRRKDI